MIKTKKLIIKVTFVFFNLFQNARINNFSE